MKRFTLMFLCALLWLNCHAQVRLSWNNRIEAPADYNAVVFRGESVILEASLTQYGLAIPLDGDATLYYAVSGSTNYTASAASVSGNKLSALWTPALDSGAARYTFFLSANMSGGRIYRANGSITIQASPGAYPPIITPTGPTLVTLQDSITASGTTNAAQTVAIASLQTGQASLTGQVNAALAMSFAAGDQATLARNTANAAAFTSGVVRVTGNYLAATQAIHTATLSAHASALSVLSGATTSNYSIATGALARANEALARPAGTDTAVVSGLISSALETNGLQRLYDAESPGRYLTVTGTVLNIDTGVRLYKMVPYSITFASDVYGPANWWFNNEAKLLFAAGTYFSDAVGQISLPGTDGIYGGTLFADNYDGPVATNQEVVVNVSLDLKWGVTSSILEPLNLLHVSNGACSALNAPAWVGLSFSATLLEALVSSTPYDLAGFTTPAQLSAAVSALQPKLSFYDTNTATSVSARFQMIYTNGYNRLFIIKE